MLFVQALVVLVVLFRVLLSVSLWLNHYERTPHKPPARPRAHVA